MERQKKEKLKYVYILLFAIIPLGLIMPYLLGNSMFLGADGVAYFSVKQFFSQSLLEGDFAFWNKYSAAGIPFESYGVFYPIDFILSFLPLKAYICTYYCFHLMLAAIFMRKYLVEIKCTPYVATIMAMLYECSIHLGGARKDHMGIVTCVALFPMIMYFAQRYINENKFKYLIYAAIGMAMQFFTSYSQIALYTDILVFFYIVCLMGKGRIKQMIRDLLVWILCYFGLIMVYLFPLCMLLMEYKKGGGSDTSYESFLSYSIQFYKVIMMIFPYIFGDQVWAPFGTEVSSEMDIELFLGSIFFFVMLWAMIKYRKMKLVRVAVGGMLVTYCYAAIAHIPVLRKIVYHIPLISGFRCPSRALFIVIFFAFVLTGIALSSFEKEEKAKGVIKYYEIVVVGVVAFGIIWGIIAYYYIAANSLGTAVLIEYIRKAFVKTLVVSLVMLGTCICLQKLKKVLYIYRWKIGILVFSLLTLVEVVPFTLYSNTSDMGQFKTEDSQTTRLSREIGNDKVWDAFAAIDGGHRSIVSQNTNVYKRIASMNTYMPFNNPDIYALYSNGKEGKLNFSGLLTGSVEAENNLVAQNDMLSMLGVKYIIDSSGILRAKDEVVSKGEEGSILYEKADIAIPETDTMYIVTDGIGVEKDTVYKIQAEIEGGVGQEVYFDLYGGPEYDGAEQQMNVSVTDNRTIYTGYINSGDIDQATEEIVLRIVSIPTEAFTIKKVVISKAVTSDAIYKLWDDSGEVPIYENQNVNPILYVPTSVQQVESRESFYSQLDTYDIKNTAYVEAPLEYGINNKTIKIEDMQFDNNQITANIDAGEKGFVMFSQCYYPGWRAYVDGKRVDLYKVNESIMGIELPEGQYSIQFKYVPVNLIIGACVTLVTIILIVIYLVGNRIYMKQEVIYVEKI